jgi:tRNA(His) 5'-end guanylyltransferase
MNTVAKYLCKEIQGAVMAYVQSDEISILINNFKTLEQTPWFANEVQKIASVSAGMASAVLTKELGKIAVFDSRVFPIPKEEVVNLLIWRQQDWERNSIQMLAQSLYSHKQLHGKNKADLNEMCFQKGHNWNDLPVYLKRGRCVVYTDSGWEVDNDIPIFKDNRRYIEELLKTEEGETR